MLSSRAKFDRRIKEIRAFGDVYTYLERHVGAAMDFTDILRSQLVYAVSAYDALLHDLIRIGMRETFVGNRVPTSKFSADSLTLAQHINLRNAQIPPPEVVFENIVRAKHKAISFQAPEKVCDGLALIWSENQKWQKISDRVGWDVDAHRKKQVLLIGRRNAIVHEYDYDPVNEVRQSIDKQTSDDAIDFFHLSGLAIADLVA